MYPIDRPAAELAQAAEALDGPFVTVLAKAGSELGVTVIAGMFEAVPGERRIYNTVVAVGSGMMLGRYRKLHLYDALGRRESDSLVPGTIDGDELLVLQFGEVVVGVVTCYDLRFPELFRALADRDVNTFAVPAAWVAGPLKEEHWMTMCPHAGDREHGLSARRRADAAHLLRPQPRARPDGSRCSPASVKPRGLPQPTSPPNACERYGQPCRC